MSNRPVEKRRRERVVGKLPAAEPGEHLTQAEQIEMIYQQSAQQHNRPPDQTGDCQQNPPGLGCDSPNVVGDRVPGREESDQTDAGRQDVRRPLRAGGHDAGQPAFEACPGHDAVLDREQREQRCVDHHRRDGESAVAEAAAIDGLAHDMHAADHEVGLGDEQDQVQKSEQKYRIHRYAIGRNQDTAGGTAGRLR